MDLVRVRANLLLCVFALTSRTIEQIELRAAVDVRDRTMCNVCTCAPRGTGAGNARRLRRGWTDIYIRHIDEPLFNGRDGTLEKKKIIKKKYNISRLYYTVSLMYTQINDS